MKPAPQIELAIPSRLENVAMVAVAKGDPGSPPDDRDRIDTTA